MAFEINKFNVVKKKRLESSGFNVECNVATEVEIDKILSVCHSASAENAEVLNGEVNYSGIIDVCILYSTVDGEIGTLNATCPFVSKFEDALVQVGDKVGIDVNVEDCTVDSVTSSNIKLSCSCTQSGVLIKCNEVSNVTTGDENICLKEDEILVNTLVGQAKEVFSVDSFVSIKEPIQRVLLCDSQVSVKSVESGVDFVSVGGEVVSRILYLTEKDRFESCYVTENFKEEIELEGVTREAISEAVACVKKSALRCELEEVEKGVNIKLVVPVEVRVTSYIEMTQTVIQDIYSTCNELEVTTESFDMTRKTTGDYFESKIDGNLVLDADKPRVDKVMFVGGSNLCVTNAYLKNGEVFVEGVTKTNVIYLNDETNALHSVIIEVPFVVSDKASVDCEEASVSAHAVLTDADVVVKKGREFFFDAKLKIHVDYDCEEISAVISKVDDGAEYPEHDCALELVFASQGQSAWEVAKNLRVSETTILLQNPDLAFPLEKDESIVVFYQKA